METTIFDGNGHCEYGIVGDDFLLGQYEGLPFLMASNDHGMVHFFLDVETATVKLHAISDEGLNDLVHTIAEKSDVWFNSGAIFQAMTTLMNENGVGMIAEDWSDMKETLKTLLDSMQAGTDKRWH